MRVDPYLARRFDRVRHHCWHLARDAWLELTGEDLGERVGGEVGYEALAARFASTTSGFQRLDAPADPCLVLMTRPRAAPHVGVYVRGRVLQIGPRGATYLPVPAATTGFPRVEFYR